MHRVWMLIYFLAFTPAYKIEQTVMEHDQFIQNVIIVRLYTISHTRPPNAGEIQKIFYTAAI